MSIAARQLRRVVIHITPVARAIQMKILKVLVIIVRQLRRVVVLILNPIVLITIAANPPNQIIIISVVIRRIPVQNDTAITEGEEDIASLSFGFFREDGF
jgi:hypothetical protein